MFSSIIWGLLVAWFLNLFDFYENVFYNLLQPIVSFDITIGFYYGTFVVIGLLFGLFTGSLD